MRRSRPRDFPASILAVSLALSCGGDAAGPVGSLCATRHGAEVCADRPEYRPGQSVTVTTRNASDRPIFRDVCATRLVGVTNRAMDFDETYDPRFRCGAEVSRMDIVARMVNIASGASLEESITIPPGVFQGWYRVNVWILDSEGDRVAERPANTGIFQVFPSAN